MNTHAKAVATASTPSTVPALSDERRSYLVGQVADSHGTSDAMIVRRIKAVSNALVAGLDVKTLVSEINAAAATPGSSVTPVSAPVLGQARAVLAFLDRIGVSLDTAISTNRDALVAVYRAASTKRAGVKGLKAVADVAVNGESPADKLAIGAEQADAAGRDTRIQGSKGIGQAGASGSGQTGADGDPSHIVVTEYARALNVMAGAVATGAYEPDAAFVAALANLVAEVQRVTAKSPVRARVAEAVAAH